MHFLSNLFELNLPNTPILWGSYSWEHLIPLVICLWITVSLYVIPKYYMYLSRTNYFLYFLAGLQLILMLFLRIIQAINISAYQEAGFNWTGIIPFDFCSLTQIFSIIVVFWSNSKIFSTTLLFPIFGSWITILIPGHDVQVNPITSLRFWEFFFAHFLSFYIFIYCYLYGKREYNSKYWKLSFLSLLIYSLVMYVVNTSLGTSFIFMGKNIPPGPIDFRKFMPQDIQNWASLLNTLFVIFILGMGGLLLAYLVLMILKPLYQDNGRVKLHDPWPIVLVQKLKSRKQTVS